MAIYNMDQKKQRVLDFFDPPHSSFEIPEKQENVEEKKTKKLDRFFSTLFVRLFFSLLLVADLLWMGYAAISLIFCALASFLSWGKVAIFKKGLSSFWLSLKRSLVCAISLLVALCAPPFGILIACTYFLMYDKSGIEEVVPSSLQEQFKEFLPISELKDF